MIRVQSNLPAGVIVNLGADCPAGKVVIGGGWTQAAGPLWTAPPFDVYYNGPNQFYSSAGSTGARRWDLVARNTGAAAMDVFVYAVCVAAT